MQLLLLLALMISSIAAAIDLKKGTIPNRLTYPVLLGAPLLHVARGLMSGGSVTASLLDGGWSLLGAIACGAIPLAMWHLHALGGGDVKLFAALGALLLPRLGFDVEMDVITTAALLAPAKLAYDGTLLRTLRNVGGRALGAVLPRAASAPLDPNALSWVRLGPCFAIGVAVVLVLRWRAL